MILARIQPHRIDRKWKVFATIAVGMFVSVLDQTGVNLALPPIAKHFDATIPVVQWVALGYILTTGSLLLPMGRLSDMIGRKRVYIVGFVIFTSFAILTGLSSSLLVLIIFRILQGVGAAMIQANAMAIIMSTFPSNERGKVIGLFMTTVGSGAVVGPILGGLLVGWLGWRSIFFIGVPFGIISIVLAILVLQGNQADGRDQSKRSGFDWGGATLSATALVVFLLVMTNSHRVGWGSPLVIGGFIGAGVLFLFFLLWESKFPDPMLSLQLFKSKLFSMGSSASFFTFLAGTAVFFMMPFYLQGVLGYTPGQTGLIMGPTALSFAIMGPISGRLSDKFGWRPFEAVGLILIAGSLFVLSLLDEGTPLPVVIVALAMQGVGMGIFNPPNASSILSTVEASRYGIATAFLNLTRNAASVTGVAVATAIVVARMSALGFEPSLDAVSGDNAVEGVGAAFTEGLQQAYRLLAGFAIFALVLSIAKGSGAPKPGPRTTPEQSETKPSKV